MKKKLLSLLAVAMLAMSASAAEGYNLTVGSNEHGTLTFKVGENVVSSANAGDEVTVIVRAGKGYKSDGLTARSYTSFDQAKAPRRASSVIEVLDWLQVTKSAEADSVYRFTMPAANVDINAAYAHRALSNDMIRAIADQTWTGREVTPSLVVYDRDYKLIEGTDYTVTYSDNTDKGVNTATATITAKSDIADYYLGTASANFSIRKVISYANAFTAYAVSDDEHPIIYTGEPLEPEVIVREVVGRERVTLVKDVDYTVTYRDNVTATSQGQFQVTGIGKYQGDLTAYFTINTRDLSSEMITPVTGIVYTGDPQYPRLTITYNGRVLVEGDDTNPLDCDYYTTYLDNTETGEAKVRIEGVNNFSGTFDYTFNIGAKELSSDLIQALADQTYDGNAKEPAPVVTYNGMSLNAGTDYTVSYSDNVNAGTATLTITSTAANTNYTGSASKTFTIQKASATVTDPTVKEGLVYTSSSQPLLNAGTVVGGEMQYSLDGETYASTVSTGTDAGIYTVYYKTVGDANHNDVSAKTLSVSIAKAELTTLSLSQNTFTYNKSRQTVQVASVSAGTIPVSPEDYTVSGHQKTNVGTYTAQVTANAASTNFKGSATAQWSIVEADANVFTMELSPESFVFTGNAQHPSVTVKDGSDVLSENTDYTLSFENNVNAGTAKVTATGKGNYKNTQEATFTIQKANAQLGTAPAARTLTHNGEPQELVSAGSVTKVGTTDNSKLQYSLDGVNFSDAIPSASDAGAYTVSYFVQGDANHNNTDTLTVSCSIQKDQGTMKFQNTSYEWIYGDADFTNPVIKYGDNELRFVSSDPRVAEVHYYTGEVSIKGVGLCTITAVMQEHKNFRKQEGSITYEIKVSPKAVLEEHVTVGASAPGKIPVIVVAVGDLKPEVRKDYSLDYYETNGKETTTSKMEKNPGEYVAVLTFFGNYAGVIERTVTVSREATVLTLSANESAPGIYWTTFYNSSVSFQADESTTVYTATLTDTWLTLNEVSDGVIESGEGVILKSSSPTITLTSTNEESSTLYGDNILQGTDTEMTNPGNAYVLSEKESNGLGFYRLEAATSLSAGKAYLVYGDANARGFLGFGGDDVTGIVTLCGDSSVRKTEIFSLSGQRVQKAQKGIYIVNGKKTVVK